MLKRTSLALISTLLLTFMFVALAHEALAVQRGYYTRNNSGIAYVSPATSYTTSYTNTYSWRYSNNRATYAVYNNSNGTRYGAITVPTQVTRPTQVTVPATGPGAQAAVPSPAANTTGTGPAIEGSATFQQQVNAALDLLRSRAPASWDIVRRNLGRIRESSASAALVWEGTFLVGPTTAASDPLWLASTIVHDSYHVQQYREGRPYVGEAAEREALAKQREALVQMGAPGYMVSHVDSVASTRYWETTFENRSW